MISNGNQPATGSRNYQGLTKREIMAMHIMSGFAADSGLESAYKEDVAKLAVNWADALLKELNK